MMNISRWIAFTCLIGLFACARAESDIQIDHAWARATAPGQKVAAAYMQLSSKSGATLIRAESSLAEVVEIHSMTMENDVMKMRMLEELPIPAGQTVLLEPGGYHLMLFDLKQPLEAGKSGMFTLHFKSAKGETSSIKLEVPIRARAH